MKSEQVQDRIAELRQILADQDSQREDLAEFLYWDLIYKGTQNDPRSYFDFVNNAIKLFPDSMDDLFTYFSEKIGVNYLLK